MHCVGEHMYSSGNVHSGRPRTESSSVQFGVCEPSFTLTLTLIYDFTFSAQRAVVVTHTRTKIKVKG